MGLKSADVHIILLLTVLASMLAVDMANKNMTSASAWRWNSGTNWFNRHQNKTRSSVPNRIVVGGSENWHFGFNYSVWAFKNGPFYLNDTLVFKYDPPVDNSSHPHSVYLLPDFWSYLNCDLSRATRVANPTQGGGQGFEFVLSRWQPYYFACGESNGIHCNLGGMKFFVMPLFRRCNS